MSLICYLKIFFTHVPNMYIFYETLSELIKHEDIQTKENLIFLTVQIFFFGKVNICTWIKRQKP
jgi:hypothetical protein